MDIKIIEDYLTPQIHKQVWEYCLGAPYYVGETDNPDTPPTGVVHNISLDSSIYKILSSPLKENGLIDIKNIYRCYINCFASSENPYWHMDGEGITCLYYPNLEYGNLNEGGETQFLLPNNDIRGILPRPNRMVLFDGMIKHRATCFRSSFRYTLAMKFGYHK